MKKIILSGIAAALMLTNLSASDLKVGDVISAELPHGIEISHKDDFNTVPIVLKADNGCKIVADIKVLDDMVHMRTKNFYCDGKNQEIKAYSVSSNNVMGLNSQKKKNKNIFVPAQRAEIHIFDIVNSQTNK